MDFDYMKKVQEWVSLDNHIIRNKDSIKNVQEKKKELEDDILDYIETNGLDKLTIKISDGAIKFAKRTTQNHITLKLIKSLLENYSSEESNIDYDKIYEYIEKNIGHKSTTIMKRDVK